MLATIDRGLHLWHGFQKLAVGVTVSGDVNSHPSCSGAKSCSFEEMAYVVLQKGSMAHGQVRKSSFLMKSQAREEVISTCGADF